MEMIKRLIDIDEARKEYRNLMDLTMSDTTLLHTLYGVLDNASTVEAIPKDQYEARLTELRSMALRVKHNTGNIDTLIDKLDDLLSEVQK